MEDEEAVRVVLNSAKVSGQTIIKSDIFKNLTNTLKNSLKGDYDKLSKFNNSQVLDESLANSDVSLSKLKNEYKANGVELHFRDLPNGKVEMLFHSKDENMLVATTEKILREVQSGSKKYIPVKKKIAKLTPLQERINKAKDKQKEIIAKQPPKTPSIGKQKEKSL